MDSARKESGGLTTYLVVYVAILALAGVQIVLAYQHTEGTQLFFRMLSSRLGPGMVGRHVLHAYADGAAESCAVPRSLYGFCAPDDEHDLVRQFPASADAAISEMITKNRD
jgi:hypothetical protein